MDYQIFKFINDFAGQNTYLDWFGIFCAEYLIWILGVIVLSLSFYQVFRLVVLKAVLAAVLGYFINFLIGLIYFRPRPFVMYLVNQLIEKSPLEKSFPSDHTVLAFTLAFIVFFYNKKLGSILLTLAFLIGLARIYVGVHYPVDVLSGLAVAFLVAFGVDKFWPNKSRTFSHHVMYNEE